MAANFASGRQSAADAPAAQVLFGLHLRTFSPDGVQLFAVGEATLVAPYGLRELGREGKDGQVLLTG